METLFCKVFLPGFSTALWKFVVCSGTFLWSWRRQEKIQGFDSHARTTYTYHTWAYEKALLRILFGHYKSDVFTWTIGWLHVHDCMITLHKILVPILPRSLSPLRALRRQAVILGCTCAKELWEAPSSLQSPASSQQENGAGTRNWLLPTLHELRSGSINIEVSDETPAVTDPLPVALSDAEAENPVTPCLDS